MKEINTTYRNMFNQSILCEGKITNTNKGITIDLDQKNYMTKEEFLLNFLNGLREPYDMFVDRNNQKEFKKLLEDKIKKREKELEELKFAHKICGRKIINN
jgi:hypothetical protein